MSCGHFGDDRGRTRLGVQPSLKHQHRPQQVLYAPRALAVAGPKVPDRRRIEEALLP